MDRPARTFVLPVPLSRMVAPYTTFGRTRLGLGTALLIPVTNLLERLFLEERRRLKIIPNAFGERPVLKLMFGAMTRAADRWRAIRFTDFERRQIAAVKQDLDQEYQARINPPTRSSAPQNPPRFSSNPRT